MHEKIVIFQITIIRNVDVALPDMESDLIVGI